MNKKEWEAFWEWLTTETHPTNYDEWDSSWLDDKKDEWESFGICPKCEVHGLKEMTDTYDGYTVGKYDQCQNCMEKFNKVNLMDDVKDKIVAEIESGHKSPMDIRYLVERFGITEGDVTKAWTKEVIVEFEKEVAEAKEFARVSQAEKDAWQIELKNRLQRVIDNDKKE